MRKAGRRMLAGVGAVALLASAGVAALPGAGDRLVQDTLATQTDRVQFDADFQTDKPLEITGQWASTSVKTDKMTVAHEFESAYATTPQDRKQENYSATTDTTTLCVYGDGTGGSCHSPDDHASASTNGWPEELYWDPFLTEETAEVEGLTPVTTGARCWAGPEGTPRGEGLAPTGSFRLSSVGLSLIPPREVDIANVSNGVPWSDTFMVGAGLLGITESIFVEIEINSEWGYDATENRAYSEVQVRYQGSRRLLLGIPSPRKSEWIEYTVRSECGLTANDGSGVTGPGGVTPRSMPAPRLEALVQPSQEAPTPAEEPSIAVDDAALIFEYEVAVPEAAYPYRVRAERDLTATDLELVEEAIADVARTPDTRTGAVDGLRWEIRSADGLDRILPVLVMELADGTVVTAEPDLTAAVPAETSTPDPTPTARVTETATPEPVEP